MTSISNLFSGSTNTADQDKKTSQTDTSLATALSNIGKSSNQGTGSSTDLSYMLNLSDEAKNYLTKLVDTQTGANQSTETQKLIALSREQERAIDAIVNKYKDEPFTEETYEAMQEELEAAGLGAMHMAAKDTMRSFSTTQLFLNVLNGSNQLTFGDSSPAAIREKAAGYMDMVYAKWEAISTTVDDGAESDVTPDAKPAA